jgi:hypothetical protein
LPTLTAQAISNCCLLVFSVRPIAAQSHYVQYTHLALQNRVATVTKTGVYRYKMCNNR